MLQCRRGYIIQGLIFEENSGIFLVVFFFFSSCCCCLFWLWFFIAWDQHPVLQLLLLSSGSPVTIQKSQGSVIWEFNSRYSTYEWIDCLFREDCQGNRQWLHRQSWILYRCDEEWKVNTDLKDKHCYYFVIGVGVLLIGCLWYFQAIVWLPAQQGYRGDVLFFCHLHLETEGQNFICFIRFLVVLGGFYSSRLICSEDISTCQNFSKWVTDTGFFKRKEAYFAQTQLLKSLFATL